MKCERCKTNGNTFRYSIALVNVDPDSFEEGSRVADVDLRLCGECEEVVADMLLELRQRIVDAN